MIEKVLELIKKLGDSVKQEEFEQNFFLLKGVLLNGEKGFELAMDPRVFGYLEAGLNSDYQGLRSLVLAILLQCANKGRTDVFTEDRLKQLFSIFLGNDLRSAEITGDILVGIGKVNIERVINPLAMEFWKKSLKLDSILHFRTLSVLARIAGSGEKQFISIKSFGLLEPLLKLNQRDDPLEILNLIELLDPLCHNPIATQFLIESKTWDSLVKLACDYSHPAISLVQPRLIGFFGQFGELSETNCSLVISNKLILKLLADCLAMPTSEELSASISAVSRLGIHGLSQLDLKTIIKPYLENAFAVGDTKLEFFHGFAHLMKHIDQKTGSLLQEHVTFYKNLVSLIDSPFEPEKIAAFNALDGLAYHPWSAKVLLQEPGFYEFLMIRKASLPKATQEWKYGIVTSLFTHVSSILSPEQFKEFELYLKMGIIFVPPETEVKVEIKSGQ